MIKLSVIIPSYKEPHLNDTVASVLDNAQTDIEVIVVLDGYRSDNPLREDPRLTVISLDKNIGMRGSFNNALTKATGEYLMKIDAHCLFAPGYDKVLTAECSENWLVIPRRYTALALHWPNIEPNSQKDYHFLSSPTLTSSYGKGIYPIDWKKRTAQRFAKPEYDIDDTMTMQGSCYLVNRKYFMEHVGFLDDHPDRYDSFTGEPLEVGLKYWLGGGAMKVNKKTWYAHLYKNAPFYQANPELKSKKRQMHKKSGHEWGARHWLRNEEPNMIHPFSWLVEKFWPVPGWPENWEVMI